MEVAAAKFAGGVAAALVGKLGQLLVQEYQLLSGLRGEVVHLRDDAAMMNALLRMFSETDEGAVDHFVREWMKQVRELSYDADDCVDVFLRRISWASWVGSSLGRAWHRFATARPRRRLAAEIVDLRARALAIGERHMLYGAYGQALQPSQAFGSRVPTSSTPPELGVATSNDDPAQLLGTMADQINSLSGLVRGAEPDDETKVWSIVGIGGVGKSTLALGVLAEVKNDFPCRAVVAVSQEFNPSKDLDGLMGRIRRQFGYEDNAATTFKQHLIRKRYLIIIDDLWTTSAWRAIWGSLPTGPGIDDRRNRIILTTRRKDVAIECSSPSYIYPVNLLSDEDSRTLFVTRVFRQPGAAAQSDGQPINEGCPVELQAEMDIIIRKCGGLPLAIVCIANVLARYNSPTSVEMWKRVCNSVGSQLETDPALEGMMQIIALSYNHLPHRLKACSMLLSIFPEDYQISKTRLLRSWICEGLIPEKRGLTPMDVAEAYYNELMGRNIIQQGLGEDGTVSKGHCRVHDMMLEVIVSKSLDDNFVSLVGSPRGWTSYDVVRRLSIHGDVGRHGVEGMKMQHVRSLSSFGYKLNSPGKLLKQLAKFKLLKVLDLEDCKDVKNHHMKQVCRLILLTFLNLNETDITVLPGAISNLKHLRILWLYDTLLKKVPGSVVNLRKLEHLSFRNRRDHQIRLRLPRGLKKMKSLQEISQLQIGKKDVKLAKEIGYLVQLRELEVFVPLGYSTAVKDALESSVAKLNLYSLRARAEECIVYP